MQSIFTAMRYVWAILSVAIVATMACGQAVASPAARDEADADHIERITELWRQLRRAEVGSAEFLSARDALDKRIREVPRNQRAAVATALMRRGADDSVNAAAIRLFGIDPIPLGEIRRILFDDDRAFEDRILVRTYYLFCRHDFDDRLLTFDTRRELVNLLAERMEQLRGSLADYGEQRLMIHLCSDALSWCQASGLDAGVCERLIEAMRGYAVSADEDDTLAVSIWGWLTLRDMTEVSLSSVNGAVLALGHWDPLIRWRAAAFLGSRADGDVDVARRVLAAIGDPRDEARAAAIRVFAFAPDMLSGEVEPLLADVLVGDRGVVAVSAAADVIEARAENALGITETLLGAFHDRLPGPKRTDSIFRALAHLVPHADGAQRDRMVELAKRELTYAPGGALELLKALGPAAEPAAEEILRYRESADRLHRHYIDRHVLPAIKTPPPEPTDAEQ